VWAYGDVVEHRHLLRDRVWLTMPVRVVSDVPDLVVTYLPGGAPMTYVSGDPHPWYPQRAWRGHGVLMLQRPADPYGVWVFWDGPERSFDCWYLNVHEWSRDDGGHSIRDLELDVVVAADGTYRLKDANLVDLRVDEGRMSADDAVTARTVADDVMRMVERAETWWDAAWASWTPPPGWDV
jgi:hypothetical protein